MESAAAMTKRKSGHPPKKTCGARTHQSKRPCGKGRGWGTPHPGYGSCKLHGGCTPSGMKAAAAEAARDFAVGMLGAEIEVGPLDAMLLSVKLAAGSVAYYRLMLNAGDEVATPMVEGYERAVERMGRLAKAALDAGVNARLVKIAERTAEQIALAAEEAMAGLELTAAQRTQFAQNFATALGRLEEDPLEGEVLEA